jgi:hypothetical protein
MVLLDGKPVEEGRITFEPEPGTRAAGGGAKISKGKYSIDKGLAVGKFRVRIQAVRETGRLVASPIPPYKVEELVPAVAPEYNEKSELVRNIRAGPNPLDFEIKGTAYPPARPPGR